jgi:hypothetical protein
MTFIKPFVVLACLIAVTLVAQEDKVAREANVTQLLSKDLTNLPGKEGLMITVDYPPGSSDSIHRHNAHAFRGLRCDAGERQKASDADTEADLL